MPQRSVVHCLLIAVFPAVLALPNGAAGASKSETALPACPAVLPDAWLNPREHPRLICTPAELAQARKTVAETPRGRKYLRERKARCERFINMTPEQLCALVPPLGSEFYGYVSRGLDPAQRKPVKWGGWQAPFTVVGADGTRYPNKQWPDTGKGVVDPKTGERYHLLAMANYLLMRQLQDRVLPALGDVYALTGSQAHARTSAILLDAIARLYPTNERGPIDHPQYEYTQTRGGRMTHAKYYCADPLVNFAVVLDQIAPSGELTRASHTAPGMTIREHVIRNILWDGGTFLLEYVHEGYQLHNGHADYMRGASAVGVLLGVRQFAEPLLAGPLSLRAMLDVNIDRNGFYYEVSPHYANHTRQLYVELAEIIEAARGIGWEVETAYAHPAMRLFLKEPFDRREVGGHVPCVGDSGPDIAVYDPAVRKPFRGAYATRFLFSQVRCAWLRVVRSPDAADRAEAARLLKSTYPQSAVAAPVTQWGIYHVGRKAERAVAGAQADGALFENPSTFYGAKGLALLRGGRGSDRYGAQLMFGPMHNHSKYEALTWLFFAHGADWSFDPGHYNTHFRFGWTESTVSHQAVVVDRKNFNTRDGGGYLTAWLTTPEVQWATARHPEAYRSRGVTHYERVIAQVADPEADRLGYWLDVAICAGGNRREDSFHAAMLKADCSPALPPASPKRPAMYGSVNLGDRVDANFRITGSKYRDKRFRWTPKGSGYAFLGNPREAAMPETVRVVCGEPAFARDFKGVLIADLTGAPGRRLTLAGGPIAKNMPRMPYLIRGDTGPGASVFAKVLRFADAADADRLDKVASCRVAAKAEAAFPPHASVVTWRSGLRDLWLISSSVNCTVTARDLPEMSSDARVALVRFDRTGKALAIRASGASHVRVAGGPSLAMPAQWSGRIVAVAQHGGRATMRVAWSRKPDRPIPKGTALITRPTKGQPVTWRIDRVEGERITLEDVKPALASTEFSAVPGKPGWYALRTGIGRFFASHGRTMPVYAVGKAVYRNNRHVARIAELARDGRSVKLIANGSPARLGPRFSGEILEAGPGDEVIVIGNLLWSRSAGSEVGANVD